MSKRRGLRRRCSMIYKGQIITVMFDDNPVAMEVRGYDTYVVILCDTGGNKSIVVERKSLERELAKQSYFSMN